MARYANTTKVTIAKSKIQIEETLLRYGIEEFGTATSPRGTGMIFKHDGKVYKINIPDPQRAENMTDAKYDQAKRQRWRILLLSIKAKLEEIEAGLVSFDDQFLAYMALPNGSTVGDFMRLPENAQRLAQTQMPKLLTS